MSADRKIEPLAPRSTWLVVANGLLALGIWCLLYGGGAIVVGLVLQICAATLAFKAYGAAFRDQPKCANDTGLACICLAFFVAFFGLPMLATASLSWIYSWIYEWNQPHPDELNAIIRWMVTGAGIVLVAAFLAYTARLNDQHADVLEAWHKASAGVERWQFSLRDLLVVMALAALTFAAYRWINAALHLDLRYSSHAVLRTMPEADHAHSCKA